MIRYFALAWDGKGDDQSKRVESIALHLLARDNRWRIALRNKHLLLCTRDHHQVSSSTLILSNRVAVLGVLFRVNTSGDVSQRVTSMSEAEQAQLTSSAGKCLTEKYWGSYVAFGTPNQGSASWVLRGPVEAPPCFTTPSGDLRIFCSNIEDCWPLGLRFTINWDYVSSYLERLHLYECSETGLNEVSLLLPGQCLTLGKEGCEPTFYWNALDVAAQPIENYADAIVQTRSTARSCIQSWAGSYNGALLQLSGGIDSSIVASCLRDGPSQIPVTCLNYFYPGSNSDERVYARRVAEHMSFELIERRRDADVSLEEILSAVPSARPSSRCVSNALFYRQMESFAKSTSSDVIFSGDGGDELFYKLLPVPAVGDYVYRYGIRPGLWQVAWDVARLAELSVWKALSVGIQTGLSTQRWDATGGEPTPDSSMYNDFLSNEFRKPKGNRFIHPWLNTSNGIAGGKLFQLSLICCRPTLDGFLDGPEHADVIDPLRSQPLVELCLRIPTYLTIRGGWDRSIARQAFANDLPRDIITRISKGGREEHVKDVMYRNLEFIRSLLLDGELSRRGILNRPGLESMLSGNPTNIRAFIGDLYECLGTEAWINSWKQLPISVAA